MTQYEGTMEGGCQCGRVRYRAEVSRSEAYLCHCRMCQKATGGFAATFVSVPDPDLTWLTEPDWYDSSPIARRSFCSHCGTPLGFRCKGEAKGQDLTFGSFDDPSRFVPASHAGAESLHEAWIDTSSLPRERTEDNANIADRWHAAGQEVPE